MKIRWNNGFSIFFIRDRFFIGILMYLQELLTLLWFILKIHEILQNSKLYLYGFASQICYNFYLKFFLEDFYFIHIIIINFFRSFISLAWKRIINTILSFFVEEEKQISLLFKVKYIIEYLYLKIYYLQLSFTTNYNWNENKF